MGTDDSVEIDKLRETIEKLKESLSQSETIEQYEELPATPSKVEPPAKETTSQPATIVAPKVKDTVQEQPQNEMTEVDKQRIVIQDYDSKIQELQNSLPDLSQQIKQLREGQTKAPSYYSEYQEKIDVLTKQLDSITENTVLLTRERNASQAKLDNFLQSVNERDFIKKIDPTLTQEFDKEIKNFKADISPKDNKLLFQTTPSTPTIEPKTEPTKTEPKASETKTEPTKTEPKPTETTPKISETENKKIEPQKTEQPKFILTGDEHGEAAKQTNLITGETTTVPRAEAVFNKPAPTLAQAAISNQPPAPVKEVSLFETKEVPKIEPRKITNNEKYNESTQQVSSKVEKTSIEPRVQPVTMTISSEQSEEKSSVEPPESTLTSTVETTSVLPTGEKFAQVEVTQDETSAEILANTEKTNTTLESLTKLLASFIQVAATQGGQASPSMPVPIPAAGGTSKPGITDAELASGQGMIPNIRSKFIYSV